MKFTLLAVVEKNSFNIYTQTCFSYIQVNKLRGKGKYQSTDNKKIGIERENSNRKN